MADVFTNDLRIREQEVGANSGSWGGYLNTSLENIAEAFSYGTEALADSAAQTLTLADGASDELRSFYVKLTGTLSQATTVTLAPNTISKVWMIENATSGGYAVTISQGSGADVTVGNGNVKMIATDGAGSGGVVYDLLTDLELAGKLLLGTPASRTMSGVTPNFFIEGTSYASAGMGSVINANGAIDCPVMLFGKSRGTTLGSNTIVQNGDRLFTMRFDGSDGTNLEQAAIIEAYVDAAPANNSVPGRLSFMTTASGAQYAIERLRIQNSGISQFFTGDGNSGIAEFHTNSSTGSATGYISIRPQGTARGYLGSGSSLLSGADVSDFILRSEGSLILNSNGNNERVRVRSDGNVGIGSVGMPVYSAYTQLSIGAMGHIMATTAAGTTGSLHISQNAHFETDGTWETMVTDGASNYYQYGGGHFFRVSGSTSAGTDITFNTSMSLTDTRDIVFNGDVTSSDYSAGKLPTNITANGQRFAVFTSSNLDARFNASGSNGAYLGVFAGATRLNNDAGYFVFGNNTNANGGSWNAYFQQIVGADAATGKIRVRTCDGSSWHSACEFTHGGTHLTLTNSGGVGTISDQRLKKNIQDLTFSLDTFKALRPRQFEWINPEDHGEGVINGFVAQEMPEQFVQEHTITKEDDVGSGEKEPNPDYELVKDTDGKIFATGLGQDDAMYVSVIQQLITKIENLETEVNALKGA